jgi:uncharacterized protein
MGPLLALLAIPALAGYGFLIEPYWIQTTHHTITAPVDRPLKIAHLSDIHTHGYHRREKHLTRSLQKEKPDVIVVTGDMVSVGAKAYRHAAEVYKRLDAPLGVWFVRGNWENEKPRKYEEDFYHSLDVHLLINAHRKIREDVWVVGMDDRRSGKPIWTKAAKGVPVQGFVLVLIHSPGAIRDVDQRADLVLAGDTHGGQIRLPGFTAFTIAKESKPYVSGWYERGHTKMYVSRGLGMSGPKMRLFCRPEIAYISVLPTHKRSLSSGS